MNTTYYVNLSASDDKPLQVVYTQEQVNGITSFLTAQLRETAGTLVVALDKYNEQLAKATSLERQLEEAKARIRELEAG